MFTLRFVSTLLIILFAVIRTVALEDTFLASILNIESRCIEKHRIPISATKSIPEHVISYKIKWTIELIFTITPRDSSFWDNVPFMVAGKLPNGKLTRQNVSAKQLRVRGNNIEFVVDMEVDKSGWADFILTNRNASMENSLYDFPIHSNKYSVNLICDGLR